MNEAKDDLYNWNSLRSQYLAEANNQLAGQYVGGSGFAPGWYWDPYMWNYTFIGGDPFMTPFGWGFYPFGWGGPYGGWGWGGFYGRYYGYHRPGHVGTPVHGNPPHLHRGTATGLLHGSAGLHSGMGFHGGGFHGGGMSHGR